ncbi:STAS domain-containing protein [Sporosarcina gallistercoris]|uniref:STAS domain-containing protein n=1 Tax=Sporosarcina gallistercoris TaxID=2762245 RepID=A0ABR8PLA4_9BACL|nr:STAS domain-containing protein [Sporosarcina gallistercoris]MBD7908958.1 STAS domain-containing protein [Sporosarcina gallistercoris]
MSSDHVSPKVKQFMIDNRDDFERELLIQAVTVNEKIEEILRIGNIDLIENAHKLVAFVIEDKKVEMEDFAKVEGIAWARHSLTLAFKLEWVSAIRRTLWDFIQEYLETNTEEFKFKEFFVLEKKINSRLDGFLNAFFISYSSYKDEEIKAQKNLVENLSVPIIPITQTTSILPLIGMLDYYRTTIIQEKVLNEISRLHIQTLILDLSGIADMEHEVIDNLSKVIESTKLMGCQTVITGLRPDVVRKMATLGIRFDGETKTLGTLQRALHSYL